MVGNVPRLLVNVLMNSCDIEKQTVAYNIQARVDFKSRPRVRMSVWEAIEKLNTLVDDSDPDVSPLSPSRTFIPAYQR
jgi:hypothetical protein